MFFNPLFIDTNSVGSAQNQMNTKLGKSQYLFSDIIKISLGKTESADSDTAPSFNLSLINTEGSADSLFKTDKLTADADTNTQNAETMLIDFLQYAFVNQDIQLPNAAKLQELMKNKELLLSKESLTNALSQLLQIYQPANAADANGTAEAVTPEKLAQQIFASLDDKGKAILNFKNISSQIKIELTKLNNQEKELFISTKIIPLMLGDTKGKPGEKEVVGSATAAGVENEQGSILSANAIAAETGVEGTPEAAGKFAINSPEIGKQAQETEKTVPGTQKNVIIPITSDSSKDMSDTTGKNPETKNSNTAVPVNTAKNSQADVPADTEATDYKLRVVEINAEKAAKEQDAKIYSLTPFEKNVLKKSNITFSQAEASAKKKGETAGVKNQVKTAAEATDTAKTITQAENEILKTNNMLFKENAEAGTIAKAAGAINAEAKPEQKEISTNTIKTAAEKSEAKTSTQQNADVKKAIAGETVKAEENISKEEINLKKQDSANNAKQAAINDENKNKNIDVKKDFNETVKEADKKLTVETEKSSLQSSVDSESKGKENQTNTSDKKESDSRQFATQNVTDKEKIIFSKDDLVKETSRQAELTKTVKTYEIIKEIKGFIEQGNRSSMTLKIMPENLGTVKVTLDMVQNTVQANIDVDNENVKHFVQTNIETLKHSLNQSGVNLGTLSVNVSSSEQKHQKFVSPFKKKQGGFGKEEVVEEGELVTNKKILGYNSYDYLA